MRATGAAAMVFWVLLGLPGALLYGWIATLLGACAAAAAAISAALLVPMPFVGAICTCSGLASDAEEAEYGR